MNGALLASLLVFIFFIAPILGVVLVIKDILKSRRRGKEIDDFVSGLQESLDTLRASEIPKFYGALSNVLEISLPQLNMSWLRAGCRLLMPLSEIGFGEIHRQMLQGNEEFRFKALRGTVEIIEAIDSGDSLLMYNRIGYMFALFYCEDNPLPSNKQMITPRQVVIDTMRKSSQLVPHKIYEADKMVSKALREISKSCQPDESGLDFLILHWATIMLKKSQQDVTKNRLFKKEILNPSEQFVDIADRLELGNTSAALELISDSFRRTS